MLRIIFVFQKNLISDNITLNIFIVKNITDVLKHMLTVTYVFVCLKMKNANKKCNTKKLYIHPLHFLILNI